MDNSQARVDAVRRCISSIVAFGVTLLVLAMAVYVFSPNSEASLGIALACAGALGHVVARLEDVVRAP